MKKCSKCQEIKELTDFRPRPGSKDGLRGQCKECSRAREARHRIDNKDQIKEYYDKWKARNIEHVKIKGKEYRSANKDKMAAYKRLV